MINGHWPNGAKMVRPILRVRVSVDGIYAWIRSKYASRLGYSFWKPKPYCP